MSTKSLNELEGFSLIDERLALRCSTCKEVKLTTEFYRDKNKGNGYKNSCKLCILRKSGIKMYKHREVITLAEYDEMFKKQKGLCAICNLPEITRRLSVDHDHKTGVIRGLLCQNCNRGIGLLGEDVHRLSNAIEYLKLTERAGAIKATALTDPLSTVDKQTRWPATVCLE